MVGVPKGRRRWAMDYSYPSSIRTSPEEGVSNPYIARGVKGRGLPSVNPRFANATSQGSVCFASRTPAFTSRSSPSVLPSCASSGGRIGRNTTRGTRQDRRRSITPSTPCYFSFSAFGGDVKIAVPTSGFAWLTRIKQNCLKMQQCRLFSRPRIGIRIVPTPVSCLYLLRRS